MPDMMAVNNFVGAGIVVFGAIVALVAVLEPLSHIAILIINYLQKLFRGPIKVEPLTNKDLTNHV